MIEEFSNYIGIFLGLISIAATAFFAHRYSEKKLPKFAYKTLRKIQRSIDAPDDIVILYKGEKVDSIYSTTIWFWNDGRKPILQSDIPSAKPLTLKFSSSEKLEILDITILQTSRDDIEFTTKKISSTELELNFSFLDHHDGVAIEVLHTGSNKVNLDFSGTILGAPHGIKCASGKSGDSMRIHNVLIPIKKTREQSFLSKLIFTFIITFLFGGLAYFILTIPTEITTTKELISKSLSTYIDAEKIDVAVDNVIENSKYKLLQDIGPYIMGCIFLLNMFFGYWITWLRNSPYPKSIALQENINTNKAKTTQKLKLRPSEEWH